MKGKGTVSLGYYTQLLFGFPHQAVFHFSVDSDCASYNSVLRQPTWSQYQIPQVEAQSTRRPPPQMPILSLRLSVVLLTDSLVINRASITLSLSLFAQMAHRTQENSLHLMNYQFAIKIQLRNSRIEAAAGQGLWEGTWSFHTLRNTTPQHPHVTTSQKLSKTPTLETFMEDSPNRHDQLLTQSLALSL